MKQGLEEVEVSGVVGSCVGFSVLTESSLKQEHMSTGQNGGEWLQLLSHQTSISLIPAQGPEPVHPSLALWGVSTHSHRSVGQYGGE